MGLLTDLHGRLVRGTGSEDGQAGRVRDIQVVIGGGRGGRVQDAPFVPHPPGPDLERRLRDLLDWMAVDHGRSVDPVVAAGTAHHHFETLHPFSDGNGRIGRLLVVLHLMTAGVLTEPTLTVSPWFEPRRAEYDERLAGLGARGDWDSWISFFADGLTASARQTERQLRELLAVQADLKAAVRRSGLRAETAMQLVDAGVLQRYDAATYDRRFTAPDVLAILIRP